MRELFPSLPRAAALAIRSAIVLLLEAPAVRAAETSPPDLSERSPAITALTSNLPLKRVGPGQFELGLVRLDQKERTITFPAALNLIDVPLEYLVVSAVGKTHESLLRTDAEPTHVHLAMLLLGAQGAGTNRWPEQPTAPLPGDKLTAEISWRTNGATIHHPAAILIRDRKAGAAMAPGPWTYTGSRFTEGAFAAQRDGSIISLITDPDALINNPRPRRDDDENWEAHRALPLPPLGTKVEVILRLER